jgi:hypothetical protein
METVKEGKELVCKCATKYCLKRFKHNEISGIATTRSILLLPVEFKIMAVLLISG